MLFYQILSFRLNTLEEVFLYDNLLEVSIVREFVCVILIVWYADPSWKHIPNEQLKTIECRS